MVLLLLRRYGKLTQGWSHETCLRGKHHRFSSGVYTYKAQFNLAMIWVGGLSSGVCCPSCSGTAFMISIRFNVLGHICFNTVLSNQCSHTTNQPFQEKYHARILSACEDDSLGH